MDPVSIIADRDIPDKAFRIRALIAASSWKTGSIELSYGEIGRVVKCARRHVIMYVNLLEDRGYLKVRRRGDRRNSYSVLREDPVVEKAIEASAKPGRPTPVICPRCSRPTPKLLKVGYCRACNHEVKIRKIVRQEMLAEARKKESA
jgi:hypothetical protein